MNQRLFHSLTVAVFASAVSTALPSNAESAEQLERLFHGIGDASDVFSKSLEPLTPSEPEVSESEGTTPTSVSTSTSAPAAAIAPDSDTAPNSGRVAASTGAPQRASLNVITHPLDGRQAATLYVQSIPVLTFLGPELQTLSDGKATPEGDDPTALAQEVADELAAFQASQGEAEEIQVRWDGDRETYVIALGDTELLAFHEAVMLPDTTRNPGEDALQATNRLRRLVGQAPPLETIPGRPLPAAPAVEAPSPAAAPERVVSITTGRASWYGPGFHGRRTASGEVFNQNALTAAHRTLPFGTQVRVTNLSNNRQVTVRINDRGPFTGGRIIDLSAEAARAVGLHRAGVGTVRLEVLETP